MAKRTIDNPKAKTRGKRIGSALRTTGLQVGEGVQYFGRGVAFLGRYVGSTVRDFTKGIKEGLTNG